VLHLFVACGPITGKCHDCCVVGCLRGGLTREAQVQLQALCAPQVELLGLRLESRLEQHLLWLDGAQGWLNGGVGSALTAGGLELQQVKAAWAREYGGDSLVTPWAVTP
jgi:hypothetical protein